MRVLVSGASGLIGVALVQRLTGTGEMADAMLPSSARVLPRRLLATGFRFHAAHLEDALTPRRR